MRKQILVALLVLPLAALAQGAGPGPGPGAGKGRGMGMGPQDGQRKMDPARMERRLRLVRTLGLAEALDLDEAQALKLGQAVAKFDDRRIAAHKELRDAHLALRRAATGEKVSAAEVDQAIKRALDARAQLDALDREVVGVVTKDLTPEKRARAVLFLSRFQERFAHGRGGMGPGMMRGRGGGMGMGMGMGAGPMMGMGPGAGACPNCPWADDIDDE